MYYMHQGNVRISGVPVSEGSGLSRVARLSLKLEWTEAPTSQFVLLVLSY